MAVVGGRPNILKLYPLWSELANFSSVKKLLVHTGQHYDKELSQIFFEELGISLPDENLKVGSSPHAKQTAEMLSKFDDILGAYSPDLVIVFGDMNSTLACALAAAKKGVPVAHVQAGWRSWDRSMPEEINRILVDHLADVLFPETTQDAINLAAEGIPFSKIHMVGNIVIDAMKLAMPLAKKRQTVENHGLQEGRYVVSTVHRSENTENRMRLTNIIEGLSEIAKYVPVIIPLHPRTEKALRSMGRARITRALKRLTITKPMGYLDFLNLSSRARFVVTDSGAVQEECIALQKPCLTVRTNCELYDSLRGVNFLVGYRRGDIIRNALKLLNDDRFYSQVLKRPVTYPYWDGNASKRVVKVLLKKRAFDSERVCNFIEDGIPTFKLVKLTRHHDSRQLRILLNRKNLQGLGLFDVKGNPVFPEGTISKDSVIMARGSARAIAGLDI
jgi:UDP-N-acetylglucosamine 2-epimerase (non-hydrolysing)